MRRLVLHLDQVHGKPQGETPRLPGCRQTAGHGPLTRWFLPGTQQLGGKGPWAEPELKATLSVSSGCGPGASVARDLATFPCWTRTALPAKCARQ